MAAGPADVARVFFDSTRLAPQSHRRRRRRKHSETLSSSFDSLDDAARLSRNEPSWSLPPLTSPRSPGIRPARGGGGSSSWQSTGRVAWATDGSALDECPRHYGQNYYEQQHEAGSSEGDRGSLAHLYLTQLDKHYSTAASFGPRFDVGASNSNTRALIGRKLGRGGPQKSQAARISAGAPSAAMSRALLAQKGGGSPSPPVQQQSIDGRTRSVHVDSFRRLEHESNDELRSRELESRRRWRKTCNRLREANLGRASLSKVIRAVMARSRAFIPLNFLFRKTCRAFREVHLGRAWQQWLVFLKLWTPEMQRQARERLRQRLETERQEALDQKMRDQKREEAEAEAQRQAQEREQALLAQRYQLQSGGAGAYDHPWNALAAGAAGFALDLQVRDLVQGMLNEVEDEVQRLEDATSSAKGAKLDVADEQVVHNQVDDIVEAMINVVDGFVEKAASERRGALEAQHRQMQEEMKRRASVIKRTQGRRKSKLKRGTSRRRRSTVTTTGHNLPRASVEVLLPSAVEDQSRILEQVVAADTETASQQPNSDSGDLEVFNQEATVGGQRDPDVRGGQLVAALELSTMPIQEANDEVEFEAQAKTEAEDPGIAEEGGEGGGERGGKAVSPLEAAEQKATLRHTASQNPVGIVDDHPCSGQTLREEPVPSSADEFAAATGLVERPLLPLPEKLSDGAKKKRRRRTSIKKVAPGGTRRRQSVASRRPSVSKRRTDVRRKSRRVPADGTARRSIIEPSADLFEGSSLFEASSASLLSELSEDILKDLGIEETEFDLAAGDIQRVWRGAAVRATMFGQVWHLFHNEAKHVLQKGNGAKAAPQAEPKAAKTKAEQVSGHESKRLKVRQKLVTRILSAASPTTTQVLSALALLRKDHRDEEAAAEKHKIEQLQAKVKQAKRKRAKNRKLSVMDVKRRDRLIDTQARRERQAHDAREAAEVKRHADLEAARKAHEQAEEERKRAIEEKAREAAKRAAERRRKQEEEEARERAEREERERARLERIRAQKLLEEEERAAEEDRRVEAEKVRLAALKPELIVCPPPLATEIDSALNVGLPLAPAAVRGLDENQAESESRSSPASARSLTTIQDGHSVDAAVQLGALSTSHGAVDPLKALNEDKGEVGDDGDDGIELEAQHDHDEEKDDDKEEQHEGLSLRVEIPASPNSDVNHAGAAQEKSPASAGSSPIVESNPTFVAPSPSRAPRQEEYSSTWWKESGSSPVQRQKERRGGATVVESAEAIRKNPAFWGVDEAGSKSGDGDAPEWYRLVEAGKISAADAMELQRQEIVHQAQEEEAQARADRLSQRRASYRDLQVEARLDSIDYEQDLTSSRDVPTLQARQPAEDSAEEQLIAAARDASVSESQLVRDTLKVVRCAKCILKLLPGDPRQTCTGKDCDRTFHPWCASTRSSKGVPWTCDECCAKEDRKRLGHLHELAQARAKECWYSLCSDSASLSPGLASTSEGPAWERLMAPSGVSAVARTVLVDPGVFNIDMFHPEELPVVAHWLVALVSAGLQSRSAVNGRSVNSADIVAEGVAGCCEVARAMVAMSAVFDVIPPRMINEKARQRRASVIGNKAAHLKRRQDIADALRGNLEIPQILKDCQSLQGLLDTGKYVRRLMADTNQQRLDVHSFRVFLFNASLHVGLEPIPIPRKDSGEDQPHTKGNPAAAARPATGSGGRRRSVQLTIVPESFERDNEGGHVPVMTTPKAMQWQAELDVFTQLRQEHEARLKEMHGMALQLASKGEWVGIVKVDEEHAAIAIQALFRGSQARKRYAKNLDKRWREWEAMRKEALLEERRNEALALEQAERENEILEHHRSFIGLTILLKRRFTGSQAHNIAKNRTAEASLAAASALWSLVLFQGEDGADGLFLKSPSQLTADERMQKRDLKDNLFAQFSCMTEEAFAAGVLTFVSNGGIARCRELVVSAVTQAIPVAKKWAQEEKVTVAETKDAPVTEAAAQPPETGVESARSRVSQRRMSMLDFKATAVREIGPGLISDAPAGEAVNQSSKGGALQLPSGRSSKLEIDQIFDAVVEMASSSISVERKDREEKNRGESKDSRLANGIAKADLLQAVVEDQSTRSVIQASRTLHLLLSTSSYQDILATMDTEVPGVLSRAEFQYFCEEIISYMHRMRANLLRAFDTIDKDHSGTIDRSELLEAVRDPRTIALLIAGADALRSLERADAYATWLSAMSTEGTSTGIAFAAFEQFCMRVVIKSSTLTSELRRIFDILDQDCSGSLEYKELAAALQTDDGVRAVVAGKCSAVLQPLLSFGHDSAKVFEAIDSDGNGTVSWDEFLSYFLDTAIRVHGVQEGLRNVFKLVDTEESGKILRGQLQDALSNQDQVKALVANSRDLRPLLDVDHIDSWFPLMDEDGDGIIDFDEFSRFLLRPQDDAEAVGEGSGAVRMAQMRYLAARQDALTLSAGGEFEKRDEEARTQEAELRDTIRIVWEWIVRGADAQGIASQDATAVESRVQKCVVLHQLRENSQVNALFRAEALLVEILDVDLIEGLFMSLNTTGTKSQGNGDQAKSDLELVAAPLDPDDDDGRNEMTPSRDQNMDLVGHGEFAQFCLELGPYLRRARQSLHEIFVGIAEKGTNIVRQPEFIDYVQDPLQRTYALQRCPELHALFHPGLGPSIFGMMQGTVDPGSTDDTSLWTDASSPVLFGQFKRGCLKLIVEHMKIRMHLAQLFDYLDYDDSGVVEIMELTERLKKPDAKLKTQSTDFKARAMLHIDSYVPPEGTSANEEYWTTGDGCLRLTELVPRDGLAWLLETDAYLERIHEIQTQVILHVARQELNEFMVCEGSHLAAVTSAALHFFARVRSTRFESEASFEGQLSADGQLVEDEQADTLYVRRRKIIWAATEHPKARAMVAVLPELGVVIDMLQLQELRQEDPSGTLGQAGEGSDSEESENGAAGSRARSALGETATDTSYAAGAAHDHDGHGQYDAHYDDYDWINERDFAMLAVDAIKTVKRKAEKAARGEHGAWVARKAAAWKLRSTDVETLLESFGGDRKSLVKSWEADPKLTLVKAGLTGPGYVHLHEIHAPSAPKVPRRAQKKRAAPASVEAWIRGRIVDYDMETGRHEVRWVDPDEVVCSAFADDVHAVEWEMIRIRDYEYRFPEVELQTVLRTELLRAANASMDQMEAVRAALYRMHCLVPPFDAALRDAAAATEARLNSLIEVESRQWAAHDKALREIQMQKRRQERSKVLARRAAEYGATAVRCKLQASGRAMLLGWRDENEAQQKARDFMEGRDRLQEAVELLSQGLPLTGLAERDLPPPIPMRDQHLLLLRLFKMFQTEQARLNPEASEEEQPPPPPPKQRPSDNQNEDQDQDQQQQQQQQDMKDAEEKDNLEAVQAPQRAASALRRGKIDRFCITGLKHWLKYVLKPEHLPVMIHPGNWEESCLLPMCPAAILAEISSSVAALAEEANQKTVAGASLSSAQAAESNSSLLQPASGGSAAGLDLAAGAGDIGEAPKPQMSTDQPSADVAVPKMAQSGATVESAGGSEDSRSGEGEQGTERQINEDDETSKLDPKISRLPLRHSNFFNSEGLLAYASSELKLLQIRSIKIPGTDGARATFIVRVNRKCDSFIDARAVAWTVAQEREHAAILADSVPKAAIESAIADAAAPDNARKLIASTEVLGVLKNPGPPAVINRLLLLPCTLHHQGLEPKAPLPAPDKIAVDLDAIAGKPEHSFGKTAKQGKDEEESKGVADSRDDGANPNAMLPVELQQRVQPLQQKRILATRAGLAGRLSKSEFETYCADIYSEYLQLMGQLRSIFDCIDIHLTNCVRKSDVARFFSLRPPLVEEHSGVGTAARSDAKRNRERRVHVARLQDETQHSVHPGLSELCRRDAEQIWLSPGLESLDTAVPGHVSFEEFSRFCTTQAMEMKSAKEGTRGVFGAIKSSDSSEHSHTCQDALQTAKSKLQYASTARNKAKERLATAKRRGQGVAPASAEKEVQDMEAAYQQSAKIFEDARLNLADAKLQESIPWEDATLDLHKLCEATMELPAVRDVLASVPLFHPVVRLWSNKDSSWRAHLKSLLAVANKDADTAATGPGNVDLSTFVHFCIFDPEGLCLVAVSSAERKLQLECVIEEWKEQNSEREKEKPKKRGQRR